MNAFHQFDGSAFLSDLCASAVILHEAHCRMTGSRLVISGRLYACELALYGI